MNDFSLWFSTGVTHIADLQGYDHILFVSLLAISFPLNEWKKLLILITAFTVGHSVSLALGVTGNIHIPQVLIEFLIALSILITAIYTILYRQKGDYNNRTLYAITLFFGLIHGLGFSYMLRSMLGREESVFLPLLYFNMGIEAGQLIIVAAVLIFSLFLTHLIKWPFTLYKLIVTCLIGLTALKISAERLLDLFRS